MTNLRNLPAVDQLLASAGSLIQGYGKPLTRDALRQTLDETRTRLKLNPEAGAPTTDILLAQAEAHLLAWTQATLQPVINASGVILHTNLGRAPLSHSATEAMRQAALNYSTLEFDRATGRRGSRSIHAEALLQKITTAEAALAVNNNAAAMLLILSALAHKKRAIIARSQLVEIGGGFRIPDVLKQSGVKLVEVGTTNKTRLADYETALADSNSAIRSSALLSATTRSSVNLVLRVHRSNFKLIGFTEEPELKDLAALARQYNAPLVDDLGSGALYPTEKYGLAHEPMVQESLQAGADLVCFSGDKLLGGPQAGIIVGKKVWMDKLKKHPLARALRADKLCLAGLSATLLHYLKDEAEREIPIMRMMSISLEQIKVKAEAWVVNLGRGAVVAGESTVGGGSLPEESIPTFLVAIPVKSVEKFLKDLREQNPPIIARITDGQILLDPRTVMPEQEQGLLITIKKLLEEP
ncbi:MAG: L-seryl-tRNA(Sec) selenium transferase [Anaerolineales bacterium]|nr:L-seryl-tRNA(Sec) selenium transferase [Anaerolineales bacterium]